MAPTQYYIVETTVKKVTVPDPVPLHRSATPQEIANAERLTKKHVSTIGQFRISDESLEKLKDRAGGHMGLIEDGGDISEDRATRG